MGFTLTISEGKDRGREFTFNQPEVCIGRTAENDVVLAEPGVSRRHVMIRQDGALFVVQDLGSANGTKVNGSPVTEDEVHDGDTIQVGPVIFSFAAIPEAGSDSTRIFNPAELEQKMAATKKAKEQAAAAPGATGQRRAMTAVAPAIRPTSGPKSAANRPSSAPNGKPSSALAKRGKAEVAPPPNVAPASARARARRQANTPIAKFKLFWAEADKKVRGGVIGGVVLLVLLGGLGIAKALGGGQVVATAGDGSKDLHELTPNEESKDVYGYGYPDITIQTIDKAQFKFIFPVTAKKATATLHFQTSGISKSELVDVAVNTIHVGFMDRTFQEQVRDQEIAIPLKYLKPNAENRVVFDNVKNPPGQEPWWLGKLWVEVQQLPEDKPENLKRKAQDEIGIGDRAWENRKIGGDSTYKAWKAYKEAKLYLEALDEKIDEYDVVRQKIKDCERELQEICRAQMLKGVAAEQQNHPEQALAIYKGALQFFPEKDHPCNGQLHEKIQNLE